MRAMAGSLALALVMATGAWAQRGMGGGFRGGGGGFRGGGGGFRGGHGGFVGGGFRGGGFRGGGFIGGGFRGGGFRGGGFFGGFNRGFGFRSGFFGHRGFGNAFFVPFAWWPDYSFGFGYGGYPSYVWDYGYGYPPPYPAYSYPDIATVSAYQPQAAPVVISQSFAQQPATPVLHEYPESGRASQQAPQATAPAQGGPTIYLIAMADGIIRPALAYWVQGTTLNYLGMDHKQKQVPLDMVDRDFSAQLNRERSVPFKLPQ